MIALQIDNPKVETLFLDQFGSSKESFFQFILDSFEKRQLLRSLDVSCKQVKLQQTKELESTTLGELISDIRNNSNT
jgi:hypothetical protein